MQPCPLPPQYEQHDAVGAMRALLALGALTHSNSLHGVATAIVTATNAGFVAAAFLGHGSTQVTKQYYHKGDDGERLQLIGPLSNGLRNSGPAAAGRLVGSHAKRTRAGPLGSESVTLSDVRVSHA